MKPAEEAHGSTTSPSPGVGERLSVDAREFRDGGYLLEVNRRVLHRPVGPAGEFVWDGTDEKVGT